MEIIWADQKEKLLMVKFKHQILLYQQYQHCTGSSKFKLLLNELVSLLLFQAAKS